MFLNHEYYEVTFIFLDSLEDQPSQTTKNSKRLHLQPVSTLPAFITCFLIKFQPVLFSNRILHYGIHRLFRQTDPHPNQ